MGNTTIVLGLIVFIILLGFVLCLLFNTYKYKLRKEVKFNEKIFVAEVFIHPTTWNEGKSKSIRFSEFVAEEGETLRGAVLSKFKGSYQVSSKDLASINNDTATIGVYYDIKLGSERSFSTLNLELLGINTITGVVTKNMQKSAVLLTIVSIICSLGAVVYFTTNYDSKVADGEETLLQNLGAIDYSSSNLTVGTSNVEKDCRYYSTLPEVNLVVIVKQKDTFVSDSEVINPVNVNTVLMFYEDNASGKLNVPTSETDKAPEEVQYSKTNPKTFYYDVTELYLNTPVLINNEVRTLGELFQGTIDYQGLTGYEAVKFFFATEYHVKVSSVTELPETLFSDLYDEASPLPVNVSREYFTWYCNNYYPNVEMKSSVSPLVSETLGEGVPTINVYYSKKLNEAIGKFGLSGQLHGQTSTPSASVPTNLDLLLDGESVVSFGNSLRVTGAVDEATFVKENAELPPAGILSDDEWNDRISTIIEGSKSINCIVHSNWDIILVYFLESLSNMNNNSYSILCKTNNTETLRAVQTTLGRKQLEAFLNGLVHANAVLGDDTTRSQQFVFTVRNLDFGISTIYGDTSVYLRNEPIKGFFKNYTNASVKKCLYYCLESTKL